MKVWEILVVSRDGDLAKVKAVLAGCPEMAYALCNYTPPIPFAVREGHAGLVEYLLFARGAHDPDYRIYPFLDSLDTVAEDRGFTKIAAMLARYRAPFLAIASWIVALAMSTTQLDSGLN